MKKIVFVTLLIVAIAVMPAGPRVSTPLPEPGAPTIQPSPLTRATTQPHIGQGATTDASKITQAHTQQTATPPDDTPHAIYPYHALLTPNDPKIPNQSFLQQINAPAAWDTATGSSAVTIAVIDTGFGLANQDLTGRWYVNSGEVGATTQEGPTPNCTSRGLPLDKSCNNLDNDGDGYPSDWRGWNFVNSTNNPQAGLYNSASTVAFHGTFVAGLAAGTGNNGIAGAGVDWHAKIMPLQALDDNGSGDTNSVAAAIRYAADHGADVINLSLGSDYDDSYLRDQIDYAISKGAVVVAAAGNDGYHGTLSFPAAYPEVVAVGATDSKSIPAGFSNTGSQLDLVAPGVSDCSTSWSASDPTNYFMCGSGTSFATPLVSGAIALLAGTGISADMARQYITMTATKVDGMGMRPYTDWYGYGLLNIGAALQAAGVPAVHTTGTTNTTLPCSNPSVNCAAAMLDDNRSTTVVTNSATPGPATSFSLSGSTPTLSPGVYDEVQAYGNAQVLVPVTVSN